MELEIICRETILAAGKAAEFIQTQRPNFSDAKIEYKGHNDLVSYVDKEAERILVHQLKNILPDAGFITEENTDSTIGSDFTWIIDPLDGTTNFIHGLPCYCVSIGLVENGNVVLGVVYEINRNECFYAWKEGGAWMNGERIYTTSRARLSEGLIATGFPYTNYDRMDAYMEVFDYCMKNTHGLRRLGSAAADMVYVACGRLDAFFEFGLKAWDIAGGIIIVQEAGGLVSDFNGGSNYLFGGEIMVSNAHIHHEFSEIIKRIYYKN